MKCLNKESRWEIQDNLYPTCQIIKHKQVLSVPLLVWN